MSIICNYVFYDYNCNGCIHGNTSNGPKCVMWHQEVGKLAFWPNGVLCHMAIKGESNKVRLPSLA
jgi:hypothetical protein